jgi:hypothetical protein
LKDAIVSAPETQGRAPFDARIAAPTVEAHAPCSRRRDRRATLGTASDPRRNTRGHGDE